VWARVQSAGRYLWRRWHQLNPPRRARENVAHHYDLDGRLYSLFLDSDRQYSCAYFETPEMSLDDAQLAKKRHIAAKLLAKPGQHVLDIGSGWGGLALYLAEMCGVKVDGVTLSQEQYALAQGRAEEKGLSRSATFRLEDYRHVSGTFDRIVSVGMFEHVGVGNYDAFFRTCAARLADDGVMLLHSIGRPEGRSFTNPWIGKYIFPGGYIPALSEVLPAIERSGLLVTDIEILRLHYAETLKAWRERFLARREEVERIYDALLPDVGVLSCRLRDGVPPERHDGVPDSAYQASGRRAAHARLHRARGGAAARRGARQPAAAAARGGIGQPRCRNATGIRQGGIPSRGIAARLTVTCKV